MDTSNYQRFQDRYEILETLGQGTYGLVLKAKDKQNNNNLVAVKKIKMQDSEEGIPITSVREICILKSLSHTNIVQLYEVMYCSQKQKLYMVFEFIEHDLCKLFLKNNANMIHGKGLSDYQKKTLMYQILKGIEYCHKMRIFHRDLKPANILVSNQNIIKIADFGLGRFITLPFETLTHEVQTQWYRAPEVLLGQKKYSYPVDVWSLGLVFCEFFRKSPLLTGDSEIGQIMKVFEMFGTPTQDNNLWDGVQELINYKKTWPKFKPQNIKKYLENIDNQGLDLLEKMLKIDPMQRITISDCLNHPFFSDINKDHIELKDKKPQPFYQAY